jgi:hypothetical protein
MISQNLVHLIETHARDLSQRWLKEVRVSPHTPTYRTFSEGRLLDRVYDVYSHLGRFVGHENHEAEVERAFYTLGAERFAEGFHLSEVIEAQHLTKRVLWRFVLEQGFFDSAVQLYQTLELYNRVVSFFDSAGYHTVRGFEQASQLKRTA